MPRLCAVPLPWRKKNFQGISINYKFGQMCGAQKHLKSTNIKDAVENARLWLAEVDAEIQQQPNNWGAPYIQYFQHYFGFDPNDAANAAHLGTVRGVVNATMNGVANPMEVVSICRWRGGETDTQGYVANKGGGQHGRVHVALAQYKGTDKASKIEQTCIIVHESTHKFADTTDASYLGKSDFPPAAIVDALTCADCYTYFIRDALGSKVEVDSWAWFR